MKRKDRKLFKLIMSSNYGGVAKIIILGNVSKAVRNKLFKTGIIEWIGWAKTHTTIKLK